jgi:hypothetical protein
MAKHEHTDAEIREILDHLRAVLRVRTLALVRTDQLFQARASLQAELPHIPFPTMRQLATWIDAEEPPVFEQETAQSRREKVASFFVGTGGIRWARSVGALGVLAALIVAIEAAITVASNVENELSGDALRQAERSVPADVDSEAWQAWIKQQDTKFVKVYLESGQSDIIAGLVAKNTSDALVERQALAAKWVPRLVDGAWIAHSVGQIPTATGAAEAAVQIDPKNYRGVSILMFLYAKQHDTRALGLAADYEPQLRASPHTHPEVYLQFLTDLGSVHAEWGVNVELKTGGDARARALWKEVITFDDPTVTWKERAPAILMFLLNVCTRREESEAEQARAWNEQLLIDSKLASNKYYYMQALMRRSGWRTAFEIQPKLDTIDAVQLNATIGLCKADLEEAARIASEGGFKVAFVECHLFRMDLCLYTNDIEGAVAETKFAFEMARELRDSELRFRAAQAHATMLVASKRTQEVDAVLDVVWSELLGQHKQVQAAMYGMRGFCSMNDEAARRYLEESARLYDELGYSKSAEQAREWAKAPPHGVQ